MNNGRPSGIPVVQPKMMFTVAAKVETLRLSGETRYAMQGTLGMAEAGNPDEDQPMNYAMFVAKSFWDVVTPGDVIEFPFGTIYTPANEAITPA